MIYFGYSEPPNYTSYYFTTSFQAQTCTREQTSSYPVGIECLHAGDHTILCWCCTVAALAGGKQDKRLPGSVFTYRWDTVSSDGNEIQYVMQSILVRGNVSEHMIC